MVSVFTALAPKGKRRKKHFIFILFFYFTFHFFPQKWHHALICYVCIRLGQTITDHGI